MTTTRSMLSLAALLCVGALAMTTTWAQEEQAGLEARPDEATAPAGDNAATTEEHEPTSAELLEQMLRERKQADGVEPRRDPAVQDVPNRVGAPSASVDVDPAVLGVAPGQPQPKLLREGEFIISRRGRLTRSPDGAHVIFVFEADGPESPELAMIAQPCRLLESMENYVQERGDDVVFILSGQVHTYRGANYILPTMMKIDVDKGNLKN